MTRGAVASITHGGGPLPALGDPGHADIIKSLKNRVPKILKLGTPDAPRAIVLVTAHWSESQPTISSGTSHQLIFDYGGFPREAYQLKYPAPGSPEVAGEVRTALENAGFKPVMNEKRGWDHGVFIPLLLINPKADVPIVQLSVMRSEDPAEHIRMGRALSALRDSNVAIVGSGFASFHNLSTMFALMGGDPSVVRQLKNKTKVWNQTLMDAVLEKDVQARETKLTGWRKFPHAYDMHPRYGADHFMPLLVCVGASGDEKGEVYKDDFLGVDICSYYWP
ncbi:4,5-DOPA dioxygenase extradiol [Cytospora mali]|uniref:4,5-DOPA dioxygenase extradiol n=1 Tax=Cytospora mali TaxID=578113 RepID=A0A194V0C2_CYTMA|nr:4,5-DOPA dioxygenase extradiol [Valsa mali var. pyri (nom. inval.)]